MMRQRWTAEPEPSQDSDYPQADLNLIGRIPVSAAVRGLEYPPIAIFGTFMLSNPTSNNLPGETLSLLQRKYLPLFFIVPTYRWNLEADIIPASKITGSWTSAIQKPPCS